MNFPSNDASLDMEAFFCAALLRPGMENVFPKIVRPVYSGIVNVDTAFGSTGHCRFLFITPCTTTYYLFLSKKRI